MELDDDTEGLQATIYLLQHQLKEAKDRIDVVEGRTVETRELQQAELTPSISPSTPVAESMDQQETTVAIDKPSLTVTSHVPPKNQVTAISNDVMVNGTDKNLEKVEDTESIKSSSEKLTTCSDNALAASEVGSNGHTEMMIN